MRTVFSSKSLVTVSGVKKVIGHASGANQPDTTKPYTNLATPHSKIRTLIVSSGTGAQLS